MQKGKKLSIGSTPTIALIYKNNYFFLSKANIFYLKDNPFETKHREHVRNEHHDGRTRGYCRGQHRRNKRILAFGRRHLGLYDASRLRSFRSWICAIDKCTKH